MSSRDKQQTETPGPVPLPPPNRRSSFSQNPSFSTLFGSNRGSPPRITTAPDPASLSRRFSWSYAPPKESAIDDSDDLVTSPIEEGHPRTGSEFGRRLSTTATSLREALGFKVEEPGSPKGNKTTPFRKMSEAGTSGTSPTSSEGMGAQGFLQRRRASFGKSRAEADPHADRMLQGHFSID